MGKKKILLPFCCRLKIKVSIYRIKSAYLRIVLQVIRFSADYGHTKEEMLFAKHFLFFHAFLTPFDAAPWAPLRLMTISRISI
nr:MAG TPA: hypothetical protein [Caudoviricetes sp.]